MKVLLLGSTGFSGREVLKELLRTGHDVTTVTRNAKSIAEKHPNLRVLEGNVLNPLFMESALAGQQAVLNCLGIGGKGNGKPNTFISDSTRVLVQGMEKSGAQRLVAMSNVGAGNSAAFQPLIFRKFILPVFMKWLKVIIDDKNRMEPIITSSNLDWTLVRCPNITDKPAKGNARPTLDGKGLKLSITNTDLARFMVAQLQDQRFIREAPCVSN